MSELIILLQAYFQDRRADLARTKASAPEPTRTRERFTEKPRSARALSVSSEVNAVADFGVEAPWRDAS
jgi:hypothetical protein